MNHRSDDVLVKLREQTVPGGPALCRKTRALRSDDAEAMRAVSMVDVSVNAYAKAAGASRAKRASVVSVGTRLER